MNDIIKRLRTDAYPYQSIKHEAADEIDNLRSEIVLHKQVIELLIGFAPIDMSKFIKMLEAWEVECPRCSDPTQANASGVCPACGGPIWDGNEQI